MGSNDAATAKGRFAGRVGLVTGASSGIGRAIALALAQEGAAVGVLARTASRCEAVVAEIDAAGGRALAVPGDAGVNADVERAVSALVDTYGGLDVVANAAGGGAGATVLEMSEEQWDAIMAANAKSCFLLAKHAVPVMRERGGGAFVNVSSTYATAAVPGTSAYAAAKAAVEAFTRTVALDHAAEGIRFNTIAPGSTDTPAVARAAEATQAPEDRAAWIAAFAKMMPLGRLIEPREIAELALFLLSPQAAPIIGATYLIDGGALARINTDTGE